MNKSFPFFLSANVFCILSLRRAFVFVPVSGPEKTAPFTTNGAALYFLTTDH